jgi:hypothetical protein
VQVLVVEATAHVFESCALVGEQAPGVVGLHGP